MARAEGWEPECGECHELKGHSGAVSAVCYASADSGVLLSGGTDRTVRAWWGSSHSGSTEPTPPPSSSSSQQPLPLHSRCVTFPRPIRHLVTDGDELAACGCSDGVYVLRRPWDESAWADRRGPRRSCVAEPEFAPEVVKIDGVRSAAMAMHCGMLAVVHPNNNAISQWDVTTGQCVRKGPELLGGHYAPGHSITDIDFCAPHTLVCAGGRDRDTVYLWDLRAPFHAVASLEHFGNVHAVAAGGGL